MLTPAVLAVLQRSDAAPDAFVFACALVANAASFVLPIANPSNLLFFADKMPTLGAWFTAFGPASLASVGLTYAALVLIFRRDLAPPLVTAVVCAEAPRPLAAAVLIGSALALIATSSLDGPLGAAAFALGALATLLAATRDQHAAFAIVRGIDWPVVALTAGLFVLVEALDLGGAAALPRGLFAWAAHQSAPIAQTGTAIAAALASNLVNNLPVGLDLGKYAGAAHPPSALSTAALVGVNVGPNLTVNGSLATILWLSALRRAGVSITPPRFAAVGLVVTPPALIAAALLAR